MVLINSMKITRLLFVVLSLGLLLSACSGAGVASSWPGVSADQSMAYIANGTEVYAIRVGDGSQVWQYPEKPDARKPIYTPPVLTADGQLLVGDFDHTLYSLNPQNGQVNWSFANAKGRWIASPLVVDQTIYAPCADDSLYALDLKGNLLWTFTAGHALWAQPATDGKNLYVSSMDHSLYAVSMKTGQKVWSDDLGGAILGTPALSSDGILYVGTLGNEMVAVDSASGKVIWRTTVNGGVWGGPIIKDGNLYFGDLGGSFYAVDSVKGSIAWQIKPDGPITASPLVVNDNLIFPTESGSLVAVDTKGAIVWNQQIKGNLYSTPVLSGDRVLVGITKGDNTVVALDAKGSQLWAFVPAK